MAFDRFTFFIASLVSHFENEEKLTVSLTFRQLPSSDLQCKKFQKCDFLKIFSPAWRWSMALALTRILTADGADERGFLNRRKRIIRLCVLAASRRRSGRIQAAFGSNIAADRNVRAPGFGQHAVRRWGVDNAPKPNVSVILVSGIGGRIGGRIHLAEDDEPRGGIFGVAAGNE
jgi:hypothetical protein